MLPSCSPILVEFFVCLYGEKNLDWGFLCKQMQDEMHKALQQRDLVQSRLDSVLKQMEAREQARALVS